MGIGLGKRNWGCSNRCITSLGLKESISASGHKCLGHQEVFFGTSLLGLPPTTSPACEGIRQITIYSNGALASIVVQHIMKTMLPGSGRLAMKTSKGPASKVRQGESMNRGSGFCVSVLLEENIAISTDKSLRPTGELAYRWVENCNGNSPSQSPSGLKTLRGNVSAMSR